MPQVTDIRALSKLVHSHGALLTIDNTILTAYALSSSPCAFIAHTLLNVRCVL
jgi:cystathionine beta-lyase/cystathionine gamma-synthase